MTAITKDIAFGIHSIAILDPSNGFLPYTDGLFEVVGGMNWNPQKEVVVLNGGSNPYPFAAEEGAASAEITMTIRQMNSALMVSALGAILASTNLSTTGTITAIKNSKGSSVVASTGIASVSILSGSEANIKSGIYLIKVVSSTTVNIYGTNNQEWLRGTDIEAQNTDLKLLAADITIASGSNSDIASLGLRITGGAGTIGMTVGDVGIFQMAKPHGGMKDYTVGATGQVNPYVAIVGIGALRADGSFAHVFLPKVKLGGLPFNMGEKAFGEYEVTGNALRATNPFDSTQGEVLGLVRFLQGA